MATLISNMKYLTIAGIDVSSLVINAELRITYADQDDTAGDVSFTSGYSGLATVTLTGRLRWDTTTMPTLLAAIGSGGSVPVVAGPEGSTTGKPKHAQNFYFGEFSLAQSKDKQRVEFPLNGKSTGDPTTNLFANGVF